MSLCPGAYAQKVVDVQSGNYFESDHAAHAAQVKQETAEINTGYAKIAEQIGLELDGARDQAETSTEVQERLNRQRNELFRLYPQLE